MKIAQLTEILNLVSGWFEIPVQAILGSERYAETAHARQFAMAMAREVTRFSMMDIGAFFGRHHTVVTHSVSVIRARCQMDPELADKFQILKSRATPAEDWEPIGHA